MATFKCTLCGNEYDTAKTSKHVIYGASVCGRCYENSEIEVCPKCGRKFKFVERGNNGYCPECEDKD